MRIPRIYQQIPLRQGGLITLDAQAVNHVARVLRLKQNDQIIVFNGQGGEYTGIIQQLGKRSASIKLLEYREPDNESPLQISLIQGISRGERMDYTLQKSVELGVTEVFPVLTQHTSVHMDKERVQKKQIHWQGVVNSACEQCGRNKIPTVHTVNSLQSCIQVRMQEDSAADDATVRIVLDHRASASIGQITKPSSCQVVFVVGPEGGLSTEEIDWLTTQGFQAAALGPRVLRTETAALAAIAVMQSIWGDFN